MTGANGEPRLAFSTLGCPDWSLERVAEAVREYGYDGIELRLVDGELLAPHPSKAERSRLREVLAGVPVVAVDTSLRMAAPDPGWEDDLRGFCEVAGDLGCDLVRVFGGTAASGDGEVAIVEHVRRAGAIAGPLGVTGRPGDARRPLFRPRGAAGPGPGAGRGGRRALGPAPSLPDGRGP